MILVIDDPKPILVLHEHVNLTPIQSTIGQDCFENELDLMNLPLIVLIVPDVREHCSHAISRKVTQEIPFLLEVLRELVGVVLVDCFPILTLVECLIQSMHPSPKPKRPPQDLRLETLDVLVVELLGADAERLHHRVGDDP